jgi:murein DD-endopeptidase MepM/ murein hydrolase activator NlpD
VLYAGHDNGYGKTIVLQHGVHFKTRYAHLDRISVHTGDTVARGARIGTVGATGHVRKRGGDGSHLHFEIYSQGKRVDPLQFLPDFVS